MAMMGEAKRQDTLARNMKITQDLLVVSSLMKIHKYAVLEN
jgi:hypothetical protein